VMSAPDREHCRDDVARALGAIGPWWCDSQLLFDGAPESVRRDIELEATPSRRGESLMLWDDET
jgi:hypothetical protein